MKKYLSTLLTITLITQGILFAQDKNPVIEGIIKEATENSNLERLAHELLDVVGPRLVGTPQMQKANEWAVAQYAKWGISAVNEQWGEWRGWERGITHIDMIYPRAQTLDGTQLAWSPSTGKNGVTAEAIVLPVVSDSIAS